MKLVKGKKLYAALAAAAFGAVLAFGLAGCGSSAASSSAASSSAASGSAASESASASSESAAASASAESAATPEKTTISIATCPVPHGDLLTNVVKPLLAEEGYELDVREFTDYVVPNTAVDEGDIDSNYFQTMPYLEDFNKEQGTDIVPVVGVHFEAMGIYSKSIDSLDAIPDGAQIGVPNDTTNEDRALKLLQDNGIIKLSDEAQEGNAATENDIVENPNNVVIVPIEAANIANTLEDLDLGVINANYAVEADLLDIQLTAEQFDESKEPYINWLCVRNGDENTEWAQALARALNSDEVRDYLAKNYGKWVVPTF